MSVLRRRRATDDSASAKVPEVIVDDLPEESSDVPIGSLYRGKDGKAHKMTLKHQRSLIRGDFVNFPHLMVLKPREGYVFHSDYFEVDDEVACILAFFHRDTATDSFAPFWGINKIPRGLDSRVTTILLDQVNRKSQGWIDRNARRSDKVQDVSDSHEAESKRVATRRANEKSGRDLELVTDELMNGAAYLQVQSRLMVKAPNLEVLDATLSSIREIYVNALSTVEAASYPGEQRQELERLFDPMVTRRGKGLYFTSTEFAGAYNLVTSGINDPTGEYVGLMSGDVNTSAQIVDLNAFPDGSHVVLADSSINEVLSRSLFSDMWASKIAQSVMLNGHRVVHIVLNRADMNVLGPRLDSITSRVDMNRGDVNMFEVFGSVDEELSLFPIQTEKLALMAEQFYLSHDASFDFARAATMKGELKRILTQFYVDHRMWVRNAAAHRDRVRLVGVPHDDVPRLRDFITYMDQRKKEVSRSDPGSSMAEDIRTLSSVFNTMLESNGDLFDNHTNTHIDGVSDNRRVIYDFRGMSRRGSGVAMAQLVNIIGFAVGSLGLNDLVVIHGAEYVRPEVRPFISEQLSFLRSRGGRVVYSYGDFDKMLADRDFNAFDAASYTIFGEMRAKSLDEYQKLMGRTVPHELQNLLLERHEKPEDKISYFRRDQTNTVFHPDLALGVNRTSKRAPRPVTHVGSSETSGADQTTTPRESDRMDQQSVERPLRKSKRVTRTTRMAPTSAPVRLAKHR